MTLPFLPALSSQPDSAHPGPAWAAGLAALLAAVHRRDGGAEADVPLLESWVRQLAEALAEGHVCLQQDRGVPRWRTLTSPVIVPSEDAERTVAPLVAEPTRLYLYRHWQAEMQLAKALRALDAPVEHAAPVPPERLAGLNALQQQAVRMATQRRFALITGGPGTGKTFTLVRILLALLEQQPGLQVAMAAPTGKAAARMSEALRGALERLQQPEPGAAAVSAAMLAAVPDNAVTLHRLLGIQYDRPAQYDAGNPLSYDLMIVDEASMIDLRLASQLLAAIDPRKTRLILLGDANQLAAVEAGAVLEEIGRAERLQGCRVALSESQRFGADSGIGRLAAAICAGDAAAVRALAAQGRADVGFAALPAPEVLAGRLFAGYADFVASLSAVNPEPKAVLAALDRFRVLCAVREGAFGVSGLNARLSVLLRRALGQEVVPAMWFHGRPVMVMRNDYALGVFNGDVGVVLERGERLEAFFPDREAADGVRGIAVARLASVETALAMTVHKSQGSEFGEVAVVLPAGDSPVVTRELLYTGVTRARERVRVWAGEEGLSVAVGRRTERRGGLGEKVAL